MKAFLVGEALSARMGGDTRRFHQRRIAWLLARVGASRIIDIGCADGVLVLDMATSGTHVTLVEWDATAMAAFEKSLSLVDPSVRSRIRQTSLVDLDPADTELVLFESFDRLEDPIAALETMLSTSKPGTRFLFSASVPLGMHREPWLTDGLVLGLASAPRRLRLASEEVIVSTVGQAIWLSSWERCEDPTGEFSDSFVRALRASGEGAQRAGEVSSALAAEARKGAALATGRANALSARITASENVARSMKSSLVATEAALGRFAAVIDSVSVHPTSSREEHPNLRTLTPDSRIRRRPAGGERVMVIGPVATSIFGESGWIDSQSSMQTGPELPPYDVAIIDDGTTLEPYQDGLPISDRILHARIADDHASVELAAPGIVPPLCIGAVIDPLNFNPIGFELVDNARFAVVGGPNPARIGSDDLDRQIAALAQTHSIDWVDDSGLGLPIPNGVERVRNQADRCEGNEWLKAYRGVFDHPSLHQSTRARVEALAQLAASGVPVVALDNLVGLEAALGDELVRLIRATTPGRLIRGSFREQISISVRQLAQSTMSVESRWREIRSYLRLRQLPRPTISVIAATNRPGFLLHLVDQVARQTYPEIELILVLHGDHFPPDLVVSAQALLGEPAIVVPVADSVVFGDALNMGLERASGAFVTKMDDDDWYGDQHLWDLVLASGYSGADLIGKAAEFVYLAALDVTIRRLRTGAERPSTTLAGGTMLMRRDDMNAIGGWRPVSRSVDRALLGALAEAGGTTHRTHGFGYLLNRHGVGHTWQADVDYFLRQSEEQTRGLVLGFAGIEDDRSIA